MAKNLPGLGVNWVNLPSPGIATLHQVLEHRVTQFGWIDRNTDHGDRGSFKEWLQYCPSSLTSAPHAFRSRSEDEALFVAAALGEPEPVAPSVQFTHAGSQITGPMAIRPCMRPDFPVIQIVEHRPRQNTRGPEHVHFLLELHVSPPCTVLVFLPHHALASQIGTQPARRIYWVSAQSHTSRASTT